MDEQLVFTDRCEFRDWLAGHHAECTGVWLVFGKAGRLKTVKPDEALEEALCFGWIDGQIRSVDETRYLKRFTPRRKRSRWSERNRGIAGRLIEEGRMAGPGLSAIERARAEGTWDAPSAAPVRGEEIATLTEALRGHESAFANFLTMPPSAQKTYAAHYLSAKAEETRRRRLEQIVARLNENKRPMQG